MDPHTALLFCATVLPLICTPGPDMLFVASQSLGGGAAAGLRATAGVCAGYVLHSLLAALGLAALVAASPVLFQALRWIGVVYLAWLALKLLRAAWRPGGLEVRAAGGRGDAFRRGFLTAALNPKGMMIYLAILPQFMRPGAPAAMQAVALSGLFVAGCAVVYAGLSVVLGRSARGGGGFGERKRRWIDGFAGGLVAIAAGKLALS
ncbi:LysE family translocator [Lysobacter sp. K5869]|uniref:LysE family translocator n=1 Tax=Lysobacter sp. K5869 TaxID=2820808 RepID=UPI001C0646F9|nr:LysE family translocator [Lysobacter sp. K5869]QWP79183.1 LysE family translocator [Lysobacter sp. K5869]